MRRLFLLFLTGNAWLAAADRVASDLARRAEQARNAGQVVRAYLLYAEAAARDPQDARLTANRDGLAPAAKLLATMKVEDLASTADISADIAQAERDARNPEPPLEMAKVADWASDTSLRSIPALELPEASASTFHLRGDERTLYQQAATACGLRVTFDPQMESRPNLVFDLDNADCRTALISLAQVTETFAFPISNHALFVARNTEEKRNEFEPQILLTIPLPNAVEPRDLLDSANAVRSVLSIRSIGWDSANSTVMVRDRATRARVAAALLRALLLPRAQVKVDVRIVTVDTEKSYHYGLSLPTSYTLAYLGMPGNLQYVQPSFSTALKLFSFGAGASLFGVTLADANVFATYSNSYTHNLYDATVQVTAGQSATLHIGDQYPIAQSLYTGFSQSTPSIYTPAPQIQFVDLGVELKISPRVGGDGNIQMAVEAEYKALGAQTFNTVPAILERGFKGTVTLREGESAIIAGLDTDMNSVTRSGLLGLSNIPIVREALSENSRDRQTSQTLIVIRPIVTRLPLSAAISPQYLLGPQRGEAVLF